jgi:cell division protein FtsB
MPPQRSKKRKIQILYSFPVVLLFIILTFATIRGVFNSYGMHKEQKEKVKSSLEDLQALEARENKLKAENEWLKTTRGQEELFREQYMVAKEGENVMVITTKDSDIKDNTVTTETKTNSIINKTKEIIGVGQ